MNPISCGAGYYSLTFLGSAATDCKSCPPGVFCTNLVTDNKFQVCPGGKYCKSGSSSNTGSGSCTAGNYCPAGSSQMIVCPPGKYCSGSGLLTFTSDCAAGSYCTQGASVAAPTDGTTGDKCTYGSFCPLGSYTPTACEPGTYNNLQSQTSSAACLTCALGKMC